jgi:cellobiose phosphorylase
LWLLLSTGAYIKETGDISILNEKIGFADIEGSDATLMDHLKISIEYTMINLGPNKLPLIGHADWNDCLNLNCFSAEPGESFQTAGHIENDKVAESVMIAGLFCRASNEMAVIPRFIGNDEEAEKYIAYADDMKKTIIDKGWDGEWFLRAYDSYGQKIGSAENDEGQIFIESQGWCVLGGVGIDNGYAEKSLNSVRKRLATKNGIVLQQPPYETYHLHLGEISSYPPGYKENAGIFTHNNTWIQIAETILGRGDIAMEYYKAICPPTKEEQIDVYRSEPYVYSQMTAGMDGATSGEGKNSWLTGTAAWSFVSLSNYILGIRADFDGLIVDPCIPSEWSAFKIRRKFRGSLYDIKIENPSNISKGNVEIKILGEKIEGNKIPVLEGKDVIDVEVIMVKED